MTADPVPRRRWPFLLLRGTTAVLAALALVQTALAGGPEDLSGASSLRMIRSKEAPLHNRRRRARLLSR
ncbi:hypothetical protein ORV05_19540 [Amycolatopsis cynarae]|uniref:Uncharacterized protein n=1 Tax=Amycolatopsis cynarae TaxID=2995223 RepID=A0ABY7AU52_9PSEU|nr:hypothetical protein [Amycolatopsis sp. HUAS 11-8]WAL63224.1 hypothetical protein ORV05_19540 [Amycolatopsis sp. HUAS 11-8]